VDKLEAEGAIQSVFKIRTEGLRPLVYEMRTEGGWSGEQIYITVIASGAPSVARTIETMSAMGVKKFMICSGAGTINEAVTLDKILIPSSAVRDEGTSYHYLPAAREVRLGKVANTRIENVLNKSGEKHMRVKTWTTDAPFRETLNKVTARRREGCSVVDTECAAAYAVAEHKKLTLGQIMIAGDIVKKDGWDYRAWTAATELREKLFHLAVKCLMEF
jgi:uridine phosphorylase